MRTIIVKFTENTSSKSQWNPAATTLEAQHPIYRRSKSRFVSQRSIWRRRAVQSLPQQSSGLRPTAKFFIMLLPQTPTPLLLTNQFTGRTYTRKLTPARSCFQILTNLELTTLFRTCLVVQPSKISPRWCKLLRFSTISIRLKPNLWRTLREAFSISKLIKRREYLRYSHPFLASLKVNAVFSEWGVTTILLTHLSTDSRKRRLWIPAEFSSLRLSQNKDYHWLVRTLGRARIKTGKRTQRKWHRPCSLQKLLLLTSILLLPNQKTCLICSLDLKLDKAGYSSKHQRHSRDQPNNTLHHLQRRQRW